MSSDLQRTKSTKRRSSEEINGTRKRPKTKELSVSKAPAAQTNTNPHNRALSRLIKLRGDIKSQIKQTAKPTISKTPSETCLNAKKDAPAKSQTLKEKCKRYHQENLYKGTIIIEDSPLRDKKAKKSSINSRLKTAQQRTPSSRLPSSDDDTIIVIDTSPAPSKNDSFSSDSTLIRNINCSSFLVVSEASDSEASPVNNKRLNQSTNSSSSTLTPSSVVTVVNNNQKGLKVPLNRSLFKRCYESSSAVSPIKEIPIQNVLSKEGTTNYTANIDSSPLKQSSLSKRLQRVRTQPYKRTVQPKNDINISPNIKEVVEFQTLPQCSKSILVNNWINEVPSEDTNFNESPNNSMLVNVNSSILNRTELLNESQGDTSMDWEPIPESVEGPKVTEKTVATVIDTNVFIHDLNRVQALLHLKLGGGQKLLIYVPWMVLQELDHLKDHGPLNVKSLAMSAQRFINKQMTQEDSAVIGQSVDDVCKQRDLGKCPDDKILSCCLQAKEKFDSVILMTGDINLRNKAMSNNIKAYTSKEILSKLRNGKCLKIKVRLQALLSQIIVQTTKDAFGDVWPRMDMLQSSPWSFEGCLKRFQKYWSSVFGQLLLKQCRKILEELVILTDKGDILDTDKGTFEKFKSKVKEFLFYLQDIQQFNEPVKNARKDVEDILEGGVNL